MTMIYILSPYLYMEILSILKEAMKELSAVSMKYKLKQTAFLRDRWSYDVLQSDRRLKRTFQ